MTRLVQLIALISVALLVQFLEGQEPPSRIWRDKTGKHECLATYVSCDEENQTVTIKKADGTLKIVKIDSLSEVCKLHVESRIVIERQRELRTPTRDHSVKPDVTSQTWSRESIHERVKELEANYKSRKVTPTDPVMDWRRPNGELILRGTYIATTSKRVSGKRVRSAIFLTAQGTLFIMDNIYDGTFDDEGRSDRELDRMFSSDYYLNENIERFREFQNWESLTQPFHPGKFGFKVHCTLNDNKRLNSIRAEHVRQAADLIEDKGGAENLQLAKTLLEKSARMGNFKAALRLAAIYSRERNTTLHTYWTISAASLGDPDSMGKTGMFYLLGEGVPRDIDVALKWLEISNFAGSLVGNWGLALVHRHGFKVRKDPAKAFEMMKDGAEKGHILSMQSVAEMYASGEGTHKDLAASANWHLRAANRNHKPSMAELGKCYWDGLGVPKDRMLALYWMNNSGEVATSDGQWKQVIAAAATVVGVVIIAKLFDGEITDSFSEYDDATELQEWNEAQQRRINAENDYYRYKLDLERKQSGFFN